MSNGLDTLKYDKVPNCMTPPYRLPVKAVPIMINKDTFPSLLARFEGNNRPYTCPFALSINDVMKPEFCCFSGTEQWGVRLRNDRWPNGVHTPVQTVDMLADVSTWIDRFDSVFNPSKFPLIDSEIPDLFDKVGALETWVWVPTHVLN